jgi:hypothetical protein
MGISPLFLRIKLRSLSDVKGGHLLILKTAVARAAVVVIVVAVSVGLAWVNTTAAKYCWNPASCLATVA